MTGPATWQNLGASGGHGIESAFLAAGEHDDLKATVTVYRPK